MKIRRNRWFWLVVSLATLFLLLSFVAAAMLAEGATHLARIDRRRETAIAAQHLANSTNSVATHVTITANDGVALNAWWLMPSQSNGKAVIVCHGVADSSYGALGFAPFLLNHGYAVLTPDSRRHGESGGFVTYGVLEAGDVARWANWVKNQHIDHLFGLGESLGAAVLIQSLAKGASFDGLVAESAYSSFYSIGDERLGRFMPLPIAWMVVREGAFYIDIRYGVNLANASPEHAITEAHLPILLIHGLADNQTSPDNSLRLARANPKFTTLWLVPSAKHVSAYATDPQNFETRLLTALR